MKFINLIRTSNACRDFIENVGNRPSLTSTYIICAESWLHQSPFPSLDLSSRCSNLNRALSPEHADESAGSCSRDPVLATFQNRLQFPIIYFQILLMPAALNTATSFNLSRLWWNWARSRFWLPCPPLRGCRTEPILNPCQQEPHATTTERSTCRHKFNFIVYERMASIY